MSLEMQELYKENILDHYKNPRNKHALATFTHTACNLNPLCGDKITIFVEIKDDKVQDISFMGVGCAISQAAASLLTEELKDKSQEEIQTMSEEQMYDLLGIEISHTRRKCALLALNTTKKAITK